MNLNDLVFIKTNPKSQFVQLQGKYAVVIEVDINATHVGIEQLELTGRTSGSGVVEVDCLDVVNDTAPAQWRAAYAVWKGFQLAIEEIPAYPSEEQRKKMIALVAKQHGIDPDFLVTILSDLEELGAI